MLRLRLIRLDLERRQDRAEEQPVAVRAGQEHRVLALPAEARRLRQRLLHERRRIDEDLHVAARPADELLRQLLEPALDHVVIVAVARIDGDRADLRPVERRQGIAFRPVVHGEHHDGPRLRPERDGRAALRLALLHPAHAGVMAGGEPGIEPVMEGEAGGRDAAIRETEHPRLRG